MVDKTLASHIYYRLTLLVTVTIILVWALPHAVAEPYNQTCHRARDMTASLTHESDQLDRDVAAAAELACLEELLKRGHLVDFQVEENGKEIVFSGPVFEQYAKIVDDAGIKGQFKLAASSILATGMTRIQLPYLQEYFEQLANTAQGYGDCATSLSTCDRQLELALSIAPESAGAAHRMVQGQDVAIRSTWPDGVLKDAYLLRLRAVNMYALFFAYSEIHPNGQTPIWRGWSPIFGEDAANKRSMQEFSGELRATAADIERFTYIWDEADLAVVVEGDVIEVERSSKLTQDDSESLASMAASSLRPQIALLRGLSLYLYRLREFDNNGGYLRFDFNLWFKDRLERLRERRQAPNVVAMLVLFTEVEVKLPWRQEWLQLIQAAVDAYPEAGLDDFRTYAQNTVDAQDDYAREMLGQYNLTELFEHEKRMVEYNKTTPSIYAFTQDLSDRLTSAEMVRQQLDTAKDETEVRKKAKQNQLSDELTFIESDLFAMTCLTKLPTSDGYKPSGHMQLPFHGLDIPLSACGYDPNASEISAAFIESFNHEMVWKQIKIHGGIHALTTAIMLISVPISLGLGGVAVAALGRAATTSAMAAFLVRGAMQKVTSKALAAFFLHSASASFLALFGIKPLWDDDKSVGQNLLYHSKGFFFAFAILYVHPLAQRFGSNLANRAIPGPTGTVQVELLGWGTGMTVDTVVFVTNDVVHICVDRLLAAEGTHVPSESWYDIITRNLYYAAVFNSVLGKGVGRAGEWIEGTGVNMLPAPKPAPLPAWAQPTG